MSKILGVVLSIISVFCSVAVASDPLSRRAAWQARFEPVAEAGVVIRSLEVGSPLAKAGMQVGDKLLLINQQSIRSMTEWYDITDALVSEKTYQITYKRGTATESVEVRLPPVPQESYPNLDVHYSSVTNDYGIRQRTLITRPKDTPGKLPGIFVVQGLSCASIENTPGRQSHFVRTLVNLAEQSEMVMLRVEKPGMGDSEGHCSQTDFSVELNGYETALQQLLALPYVDTTRVVVYGSSMGSAIAPYLVNKYQLNGVAANGTFYRSWFEHMLEIERRIKRMQGLSEATINQQMIDAYIPLYYGMLIEKQSYAELIAKNPLLETYNYHQDEHMYGRPMRYYHQLQDFNVAGEWEKLKVPVRIRWGTLDWIMSEADNDMIVETLTRQGHNDVVLEKYPNLDHWYSIHQSAKDSFEGKAGQWQEGISDLIVDWVKALNKKANS